MRNIKGDNGKMWKPYEVYINGRLMVKGMAPTTLQDGGDTRFQRLSGIIKDSLHYGKVEKMSFDIGILKLYMNL